MPSEVSAAQLIAPSRNRDHGRARGASGRTPVDAPPGGRHGRRHLSADPDRRAGSRNRVQPGLSRLADLLRDVHAEDGGRRAGRAQPPSGGRHGGHLDAGAGRVADLGGRRDALARRLRPFGWLAVALVFAQALLGGITVLLRLPTPISTAHTATSLLFFMTVLYHRGPVAPRARRRRRRPPRRWSARAALMVSRRGVRADGAGRPRAPLGRGARLHRRAALPGLALAGRAPDRSDSGAAPPERDGGGLRGARRRRSSRSASADGRSRALLAVARRCWSGSRSGWASGRCSRSWICDGREPSGGGHGAAGDADPDGAHGAAGGAGRSSAAWRGCEG